MKTYSGKENLQDVFAMFVNKSINDGFVVDIGCKTPGLGNNSALFLENGWSGVGVDINDYKKNWDSYPNFKFLQLDTTIKENIDLLFSNCPKIINFLSLDVDEASYLTLKNIDLNNHNFVCICIEHDYYRFGEELRTPQREILDKKYSRVIQTQAEDWYVDFSLLENDVVNKLKSIPIHNELYGYEMDKILNWLDIQI